MPPKSPQADTNRAIVHRPSHHIFPASLRYEQSPVRQLWLFDQLHLAEVRAIARVKALRYLNYAVGFSNVLVSRGIFAPFINIGIAKLSTPTSNSNTQGNDSSDTTTPSHSNNDQQMLDNGQHGTPVLQWASFPTFLAPLQSTMLNLPSVSLTRAHDEILLLKHFSWLLFAGGLVIPSGDPHRDVRTRTQYSRRTTDAIMITAIILIQRLFLHHSITAYPLRQMFSAALFLAHKLANRYEKPLVVWIPPVSRRFGGLDGVITNGGGDIDPDPEPESLFPFPTDEAARSFEADAIPTLERSLITGVIGCVDVFHCLPIIQSILRQFTNTFMYRPKVLFDLIPRDLSHATSPPMATPRVNPASTLFSSTCFHPTGGAGFDTIGLRSDCGSQIDEDKLTAASLRMRHGTFYAPTLKTYQLHVVLESTSAATSSRDVSASDSMTDTQAVATVGGISPFNTSMDDAVTAPDIDHPALATGDGPTPALSNVPPMIQALDSLSFGQPHLHDLYAHQLKVQIFPDHRMTGHASAGIDSTFSTVTAPTGGVAPPVAIGGVIYLVDAKDDVALTNLITQAQQTEQPLTHGVLQQSPHQFQPRFTFSPAAIGSAPIFNQYDQPFSILSEYLYDYLSEIYKLSAFYAKLLYLSPNHSLAYTPSQLGIGALFFAVIRYYHAISASMSMSNEPTTQNVPQIPFLKDIRASKSSFSSPYVWHLLATLRQTIGTATFSPITPRGSPFFDNKDFDAILLHRYGLAFQASTPVTLDQFSKLAWPLPQELDRVTTLFSTLSQSVNETVTSLKTTGILHSIHHVPVVPAPALPASSFHTPQTGNHANNGGNGGQRSREESEALKYTDVNRLPIPSHLRQTLLEFTTQLMLFVYQIYFESVYADLYGNIAPENRPVPTSRTSSDSAPDALTDSMPLSASEIILTSRDFLSELVTSLLVTSDELQANYQTRNLTSTKVMAGILTQHRVSIHDTKFTKSMKIIEAQQTYLFNFKLILAQYVTHKIKENVATIQSEREMLLTEAIRQDSNTANAQTSASDVRSIDLFRKFVSNVKIYDRSVDLEINNDSVRPDALKTRPFEFSAAIQSYLRDRERYAQFYTTFKLHSDELVKTKQASGRDQNLEPMLDTSSLGSRDSVNDNDTIAATSLMTSLDGVLTPAHYNHETALMLRHRAVEKILSQNNIALDSPEVIDFLNKLTSSPYYAMKSLGAEYGTSLVVSRRPSDRMLSVRKHVETLLHDHHLACAALTALAETGAVSTSSKNRVPGLHSKRRYVVSSMPTKRAPAGLLTRPRYHALCMLHAYLAAVSPLAVHRGNGTASGLPLAVLSDDTVSVQVTSRNARQLHAEISQLYQGAQNAQQFTVDFLHQQQQQSLQHDYSLDPFLGAHVRDNGEDYERIKQLSAAERGTNVRSNAKYSHLDQPNLYFAVLEAKPTPTLNTYYTTDDVTSFDSTASSATGRNLVRVASHSHQRRGYEDSDDDDDDLTTKSATTTVVQTTTMNDFFADSPSPSSNNESPQVHTSNESPQYRTRFDIDDDE